MTATATALTCSATKLCAVTPSTARRMDGATGSRCSNTAVWPRGCAPGNPPRRRHDLPGRGATSTSPPAATLWWRCWRLWPWLVPAGGEGVNP